MTLYVHTSRCNGPCGQGIPAHVFESIGYLLSDSSSICRSEQSYSALYDSQHKLHKLSSKTSRQMSADSLKSITSTPGGSPICNDSELTPTTPVEKSRKWSFSTKRKKSIQTQKSVESVKADMCMSVGSNSDLIPTPSPIEKSRKWPFSSKRKKSIQPQKSVEHAKSDLCKSEPNLHNVTKKKEKKKSFSLERGKSLKPSKSQTSIDTHMTDLSSSYNESQGEIHSPKRRHRWSFSRKKSKSLKSLKSAKSEKLDQDKKYSESENEGEQYPKEKSKKWSFSMKRSKSQKSLKSEKPEPNQSCSESENDNDQYPKEKSRKWSFSLKRKKKSSQSQMSIKTLHPSPPDLDSYNDTTQSEPELSRSSTRKSVKKMFSLRKARSLRSVKSSHKSTESIQSYDSDKSNDTLKSDGTLKSKKSSQESLATSVRKICVLESLSDLLFRYFEIRPFCTKGAGCWSRMLFLLSNSFSTIKNQIRPLIHLWRYCCFDFY